MSPKKTVPVVEEPKVLDESGPAAGMAEDEHGPVAGSGSGASGPAAGGVSDEEQPAPQPVGEGKPMGATGPLLSDEEASELPGVPHIPLPLPVTVDVPSDPSMLNMMISDADMKKLWADTGVIQDMVETEVFNLDLASALIERLEKARTYILAGKDYYNEADRLVGEVQHRLEFQRRVKQATKKTASWIFGYEVFWLVGFGAGLAVLLFNQSFAVWMISLPFATINIPQFLNSLMWGGLGGVVGALHALWRHTSEDQDFDSQYTMWYITNPILGVALGAFTFLVIQAGFISMTAGAETNEPIRSAAIIYILAWIGGFKQNVVYEIVRRILDVFRIELPAAKDQATTPKEK